MNFNARSSTASSDSAVVSVSSKKLYRFAYAHISVICLLALLFASLLISVANDMYAFVKPDQELSVTIEQPSSLSDIAMQLERSGVIQNPTVFELYVQSKNRTQLFERFSGTLTLNSAMSYREILIAFTDQTS